MKILDKCQRIFSLRQASKPIGTALRAGKMKAEKIFSDSMILKNNLRTAPKRTYSKLYGEKE